MPHSQGKPGPNCKKKMNLESFQKWKRCRGKQRKWRGMQKKTNTNQNRNTIKTEIKKSNNNGGASEFAPLPGCRVPVHSSHSQRGLLQGTQKLPSRTAQTKKNSAVLEGASEGSFGGGAQPWPWTPTRPATPEELRRTWSARLIVCQRTLRTSSPGSCVGAAGPLGKKRPANRTRDPHPPPTLRSPPRGHS